MYFTHTLVCKRQSTKRARPYVANVEKTDNLFDDKEHEKVMKLVKRCILQVGISSEWRKKHLFSQPNKKAQCLVSLTALLLIKEPN